MNTKMEPPCMPSQREGCTLKWGDIQPWKFFKQDVSLMYDCQPTATALREGLLDVNIVWGSAAAWKLHRCSQMQGDVEETAPFTQAKGLSCAPVVGFDALCQCDGGPVSQHGGNSGTAVSMKGNSIVCVNKLASGGPVHIALATKKTKKFNLSDGVWGKVTAEVQELLCWVFADPVSSGEVATMQHRRELGDTTIAEESDTGARRWTILRL